MSGAVAAHAAYNGSGTQGLAVTNKIHDDDGDVMSVFWNKNDTTRQLLYGSSIIEIPASGSGGNLGAGGNQIFTVNNDIDAIGDLYLQLTVTDSNSCRGFDLLHCIKRIEFMVGTQIWQTLETNDIGALNMTETSEDMYTSFVLAMSGGFDQSGARNLMEYSIDGLKATTTTGFSGVLRIPCLSRSLGPKLAKFSDISEQSYLLAAAPHQAVKIRVYMSSNIPSAFSAPKFSLKLFGQCIVMCNEEREQIKSMPMGLPKRLKMTQSSTSIFDMATTTPPEQHIGDAASTLRYVSNNIVTPCKIDLDHFSLYASHIILIAKGISDKIKNISIDKVDLKLNSSSFSGTIEGALMTGSVSDSLGLYSNGFYLGSQNLVDNYYVFPLASLAYGGSSVPLNRFDNIRMEVSVVTACEISSVNGLPHTTGQNFSITATCVGETTALYKGGAASLAMY